MTKLITFATLALAAVPTFAVDACIPGVDCQELPIPGVLPLLALGVVAVAAVRRFKK